MEATRLTLVAALASLGCATERQLYPGPALPPDRVAVVAESAEVSIERIDRDDVRGDEWEILPGDHLIAVETIAAANVNLASVGQSSRVAVKMRCEIEFGAVAGRRYVAMRSGVLPGTEHESAEGELRVWLDDGTGSGDPEKTQRCESSVLGTTRPAPPRVGPRAR